MAKHRTNVVAMRLETITVGDAARRFLAERDLAPGTRRVYAVTFEHLAAALGADTALAAISTDDLRGHLAERYRTASPATHNRHLATIGSLFGWAARRRLIATDPSEGPERRREPRSARQADQQRAIPYAELEALWGRKSVALREKVLWRMLYETGARANEILGLDVHDLDPAERSARLTGKGGHAERVYWATGTARILPRLISDRRTGPVFLTERRPRIAVATTDLDAGTGRARLSYRRAAEQFTDASGGWTLHQLRHSRLTHLAEEGVDVALLKAKSRHRSLRSLERYVRPSDAAVARLTAEHDPARRR